MLNKYSDSDSDSDSITKKLNDLRCRKYTIYR